MINSDFLSGELEADSYQRLKSHTLGQIDNLNIQIADLEITDTAFQKYARYGMSLLKDLTWYFQEAGPEAQKKTAWFDLPGKIDLSRWKISNRWFESSACDYLTENQWVTK